MLIRHRKAHDIRPSEITPKDVYLNRRRFLAAAAVAGAGAALGPALFAGAAEAARTPGKADLKDVVKSPFSTDEKPTEFKYVTGYNNFYEFGYNKEDPAANSGDFTTKPWSIKVDGAVGKPGTYAYEDVFKMHKLEERIYRLRCVEAWSMVVPWIGIPLASVLKQFEPTADAKFVAFQTILDPAQMPGQRLPILQWPYVEGLRMDEAMNPLAILAVGLYGEELPNQNGAPIRLVVPWKYGFKSIKSIVRISLVDKMPPTSWNRAAPNEYGFYANVNPRVDHPRWSQFTERRVGDFLRRPTLMFNGYGDEVAALYKDMDLRKNF